MLRVLMVKVDNMQEYTGNVSRDRKILRKNQTMLEIKNTIREMQNAFNG